MYNFRSNYFYFAIGEHINSHTLYFSNLKVIWKKLHIVGVNFNDVSLFNNYFIRYKLVNIRLNIRSKCSFVCGAKLIFLHHPPLQTVVKRIQRDVLGLWQGLESCFIKLLQNYYPLTHPSNFQMGFRPLFLPRQHLVPSYWV